MTIREAVAADIKRRLWEPLGLLRAWKEKRIAERLFRRRLEYSSGRLNGRFYPAKNVARITPETIQMDCPECGGDGDWGKFLFHGPNAEAYAEAFGVELPYVKGTMPCIDCKGTGRIYA